MEKSSFAIGLFAWFFSCHCRFKSLCGKMKGKYPDTFYLFWERMNTVKVWSKKDFIEKLRVFKTEGRTEFCIDLYDNYTSVDFLIVANITTGKIGKCKG